MILVGCTISLSIIAQSLTPEQYIETYKDLAIREMKRMGVPAAITLAQGLLETENGNSKLLKKSNNHFGIKCKSSWTAAGVSHDDDAPGECFRTYKTAEDSYRDHSNFLRGSDRYAFLFRLHPTDYKAWARGLKTAGYATNPSYPDILIRSIERYNLQQYSKAGAGQVPKFESNEPEDAITFDQNEIMDRNEPGDSKSLPSRAIGKDEQGSVHLVNGIKCIQAKKGIALLAIATEYNIRLQKLLEINELEDGILEEDQLIFLQSKAKTGEKDYVITQGNQTLYAVAQDNGIQLQSLLDYNQFTEDAEIAPGTKLYLKETTGPFAANRTTPASSGSNEIIYEVRPKDGLYSVAKKHSVTVQQLKEWNNLSTNELKVGQQLIVGK